MTNVETSQELSGWLFELRHFHFIPDFIELRQIDIAQSFAPSSQFIFQ
jgi:hypothetical protein